METGPSSSSTDEWDFLTDSVERWTIVVWESYVRTVPGLLGPLCLWFFLLPFFQGPVVVGGGAVRLRTCMAVLGTPGQSERPSTTATRVGDPLVPLGVSRRDGRGWVCGTLSAADSGRVPTPTVIRPRPVYVLSVSPPPSPPDPRTSDGTQTLDRPVLCQ